MRHFQVDVPLYGPCVVHLVISKDLKGAHKSLKVRYRKTCARSGGELHTDDYDFFFFIHPKCLTYEWIAHELYHATEEIKERVGILPDNSNSEPGARIAGFLHDWVHSTLQEHKIKVRYTSKS